MIKRIVYTVVVAAVLPLSRIYAQPGTPPEPVPPMPPGATNNMEWGHHHGWKGMTPEERFQHLSEELNLTDDQKPKVQAVFDEWRATMEEAKTNAETQLQTILSPEQYQKFQSLHRHRGGWHHEGGDTNNMSGDTNSMNGDSSQ